jgi:hemoglobin
VADDWQPGPTSPPYDALGGEPAVRALTDAFYDEMARLEPALAALHRLDDRGEVDRETRDRFALFLVGWLGGPQEYMARHGHPRLRMRHAHLPVDATMRDAWIRCMQAALDARGVKGELRRFLDHRFAEVANFLRNRDVEG